MKLVYERTADGEIAVGKDTAQWTPEGKLKKFDIFKLEVGAPEKKLR